MAEQLKQGYLYTREGEKFIPETLIENVKTRSGKTYDTRVREYLNDLNSSLSAEILGIKSSISTSNKDYETQIKNLENKNSEQDTSISQLQSKDTTIENKIETIENDIIAIESTDLVQSNDISELINRTENIDNRVGEDKLFITDKNKNVIAYVDGDGVHSIDFINKDEVHFNELVNKLKNFNDTEGSDGIYIIDNDKNVAISMKESGITALDFFAKEQKYSLAGLNGTVDTHETLISKNTEDIGKNIEDISNIKSDNETLISNLENYYGYNKFGLDGFYIIDNENNVAIQMKENGITALNFFIKDGEKVIDVKGFDTSIKGHDATLLALGEDVSENAENISKNTEDISGLTGRMTTAEGKLTTAEGNISNLSGRMETAEGKVSTIEGKLPTMETLISNNKNAIDDINDSNETLIGNLENYYGYNKFDVDAFHFIDKNDNVVALVNGNGITTTNLYLKNGKNMKNNVMFFEHQGTVTMNI